MANNVLQLNKDKTEMMIFAPDNMIPKIKQALGFSPSSDRSEIRVFFWIEPCVLTVM